MNLIKAHGEKGSGPFSFERLATSPPQADHVLVDLFFIRGRPAGCVKAPRHMDIKQKLIEQKEEVDEST